MNKEQIKLYLLKRDPKLLSVIRSVTYPVFHRKKDIYNALLYSIISQQLSLKAAATIHARVLNLFPDKEAKPELLLRMPTARLQSAGLSKQKTAYLKAVAKASRNDGLAYDILSKKSDAELIRYLTQIHGVGQWTVEMLLMFSFNRKDIFPVSDVGIQNSMRRLYGLEEEAKEFKQKLIMIAQNWQPYRTVVCRYLWRWKDSNYLVVNNQ